VAQAGYNLQQKIIATTFKSWIMANKEKGFSRIQVYKIILTKVTFAPGF
jgi:hypothetical protein